MNRSKIDAKRCHVCGDQAYAFNYNGLTCESCKSFFRRNAFNFEDFICKRGENCMMDIKSRRFCQKCRLKKCFDIGMRKELLKKPESDSNDDIDSGEDNKLVQLYSYEHNCIEIVKKVTTIFYEKPICKLNVLGYAHDIGQVFSNRENFIKRMVKFGQNIEGFKCLSTADQMVMIGASFSEMVMLRSAFYFNFEKDSLIIRLDHQGNRSVYVKLDQFYGSETNYLISLHRTLAYIIRDLIEEDVFLLELIVLLLMFKNTAQIDRPELVKYHYTKYGHLMEKYLTVKLQSKEKAKEKLHKLKQFIDDVGPLKKGVNQIAKHLDQPNISEGLRKYMHSLVT